MKQRKNFVITLSLLALATAGSSCGLMDKKDDPWGDPTPPSGSTDESGDYSSGYNPYTSDPGTANNTSGTSGSANYNYSGSGSYGTTGSDPYGSGYTNTDRDSTTGSGASQSDPTRVDGYVAVGGTTGSGDTGSGTGSDSSEPGSGYKVFVQITPSLAGWFICGVTTPQSIFALATTVFRWIGTLARWLNNGLLLFAAGTSWGCNAWITGSVGNYSFDVNNIDSGKQLIVPEKLTRDDLVGREVRIKLVNSATVPFLDVEALRVNTPLGECVGRIEEQHLTNNSLKLSCTYSGRNLSEIQDAGRDVADTVQSSSEVVEKAQSEGWWDGALSVLKGFADIVDETAVVEVSFR